MNNTMAGLENVLTFADLQIAARTVAPIFLRDTFLNFLFGLRIFGIILSFILLILILLFRMKLIKIKTKKEAKVGMSGIEKDSLLNDVKINTMFKKINDYISFENILYWKLALAEVDSYLNNVIIEIGFKGSDMSDRLCKMSNEYLSNLEDIKEIHQKVTEILDDNNYLLTKEETEKRIEIYKGAIDELKKM
jgi:hypothetical protein